MSGDSIEFEHFKLERVIDESALYKSITLQGTYKGHMAVVRLEKKPFASEATQEALNDPKLSAERELINDIYHRFKLTPSTSSVNELKAIVVWPANETVLAKYSRSETSLFTEKSSTYHNVVEPFIANMLATQGDYNLWVYNILDGLTEQDHVFYNDPDPQEGFILLPSLKSGDSKEPHVLAICRRRDIRSVRDLNKSHLPLLVNMLDTGTKKIREQYPDNKGELRAYVHYQPTFYHFHVHFELVDASEYRSSDRDNLLVSIIENITLMSDYYEKASLTYPLSKASALYKELAAKSLV